MGELYADILHPTMVKRLRDRVGPDPRVLFVGINPGIRSAEIGHHFAGSIHDAESHGNKCSAQNRDDSIITNPYPHHGIVSS
jgi:hypothetical protein